MSLRPWTRSLLSTVADTLHASRASRRRRSRRRHHYFSEPLESRTLLTTIISTAGSPDTTFEYSPEPGRLIRIRISGNVEAEILGASVSGLDNRARIGNLPGRLTAPNQPPVDIAGGPGGPGGIDIIGPVTSNATGTNPDVNALAAHPTTGAMYAFDIETIEIPNPPQGAPQFITNVYLLQLTFPSTPPAAPYGPGPANIVGVSGAVVAEISDELEALSAGGVIVSVAAADFSPINGLLYFVARSGEDGIDQMFTMDVNAASPENTIQLIPGTFQDPGEDGVAVAGLTWDQTSPGTAQLIIARGDDPGAQGGGGGGGGGAQQQAFVVDDADFFIVNPNNTNFLTPIPAFIPDEDDGPTVGGIQTFNDNPNTIDSILVIGNDTHFRLLRGQGVQNGLLLDLGPLAEPPTPPGDPAPPAGWVPTAAGGTGIMFVPTIFDPFSQTLGAYIGYDAATDRLFFVNAFESGNPEVGTTLFQVYIASSDATGRIAIGNVNLADPARPMQPFQGAPIFAPGVTTLRVTNAQNGQNLDVAGPGGAGPVFIGAVTRNLGDPPDDEDRRPLLVALVSPGTGLGLLPVSSLAIDFQTGLPLVPAGITINGDLDRLMVDGALSGSLNAVPGPIAGTSGSLNQAYFGWLITGQANGEIQFAGPTRPQNFRVLGDLRDLYVLDSVGTQDPQPNPDEPTYVTGFDLSVGGKLGHVRTGDMWLGNFTVVNHPDEDASRGLDIVQTEIEFRTTNNSADSAWDLFEFSANPIFFNDTFDTPQYLGALDLPLQGQFDVARVTGLLQHIGPGNVNDWVDYYAITLMAGQSVQVQLLGGALFPPGFPYVGVFDPDGRLIATDESDAVTAYGTMFGFIADRPGSYRFAVSLPGNFGFYNIRQNASNIAAPYELRVTGIGNLGVGGIAAANVLLDVGPLTTVSSSYTLEFGDVGELRAGTALASIDFGLTTSATVRVNHGNLRSLDGASIGYGTPSEPPDPADPLNPGTAGTFNALVQVDVPAGSVGLVRARTGVLGFNLGASLGRAIGGDYQLIDGVSSVYVEAIADRGIGIIRAGDMATLPASTITANFDNVGNDGIIDLIDVVGNFGTLNAGGPGISTNSGGNVRFIRVGGLAFADLEFGGAHGIPLEVIYEFGTVPEIKDDSGSTMRFIMNPPRRFTAISADGATIEQLEESNRFGVRAYPIRGSGGVALIDITAGDTFTIEGGGNLLNATAEIGRIIILPNNPAAGVVLDMSAGGPVFPDPTNFQTGFEPLNPGFGGDIGEPDYRRAPNPLIMQPQPGQPGGPLPQQGGGTAIAPGQLTTSLVKPDLDIFINGSTTIDVWDIVVGDAIQGPWAEFDGKLSSIQNNTRNGELINIRAASVGEIVSRGTIGIANSHGIPGLTLNPLRYYDDFNTADDEGNFPGAVGAPDSLEVFGYTRYYATLMGQFPYIDQRYGVWIYGDLDENEGATEIVAQRQGDLAEPGNVRSIRAFRGVGNILVNGSIGELLPNFDGEFEDGVFEGIRGIVWARGHAEGTFYPTFPPSRTGRPNYGVLAVDSYQDRGGDIWYVDIGEGIAASGSGSAIRAGIYAGRHIDLVFGQNADIRGNIIAGDEWEAPRNFIPIDRPDLPDGTPNPILFDDLPNALNFDDSIRRIELRNGSIINANIGQAGGLMMTVEQALRVNFWEAFDAIDNPEFEVGRISVSGPNSGIIGTAFFGADLGLIDVNRGFGVFSSSVMLAGEGVLGGIEADNYGIRNTRAAVGANMNFALAHGDGSSVSTAAFSREVRRSEGFGFGQVDPLSGMVPNPLTDIHAWLGTSAAQPEIPGRTDTGVMESIDFRGTTRFGNVRAWQIRAVNPDLLPSVINFGNSFGTLAVRDLINGLKITTGTLGNFQPGSDVFNLDLTVAGPIRELLIKGDLAEGSVIRTEGPVGNMGNIRINGRLDGDILATGRIKRLFVGESVSGTIAARRAGRGKAVGKLIIGGDIAEGGLAIQGNMGKLVFAGNFGRTGTDFVVTGNLGSLKIGGDLFSNIRVGGKFGKLTVGGSIISGVTVAAGRLGSVNVGGDVQPGVTFISSRAPKIKTRGQMLGTVQIV